MVVNWVYSFWTSNITLILYYFIFMDCSISTILISLREKIPLGFKWKKCPKYPVLHVDYLQLANSAITWKQWLIWLPSISQLWCLVDSIFCINCDCQIIVKMDQISILIEFQYMPCLWIQSCFWYWNYLYFDNSFFVNWRKILQLYILWWWMSSAVF